MAHSDQLLWFGIVLIAIISGFIAVPYLRGKSDLLTAWNALLLGLITFTGLGSIEVKYVPKFPWEHLNWFQPKDEEVRWYMLASSAFTVALIAAYYGNTWAKNFAARRLQKWPEQTPILTFFVIGFCFIVASLAIALRGSAFFGTLLFNLAWIGTPAASVFSFALWNRNRRNMAWLSLFIGVFMWVAIYAMVMSVGRRLLVSAFMGPVICLYWTQIRYWRPSRALTGMSLAAFFILSISAVYSKIRHEDTKNRSTSAVVKRLKEVRQRGDWLSVLMKDKLDYFAQMAGHYSLLTQRFVEQDVLPPVPLNTLRFLAVYPVPRKLWPEKPVIIGVKITRDAANIPGTNWGVGIAGHGAYEGGIPALILYAVLLAFVIRLIDEPLKRQPDNPFLLYILASSFPHIMSIPRGDMGGMVVHVGQSFIFALILGLVCRVLFGTRRPVAAPLTSAGGVQYGPYHALRTPPLNR